MKRILIVPFAGSIIFFSASLFAQLQSRSLESIAPSEVFIANPSSTHTVNFRISGNRCSPPVDASLRPDHYGTYKCKNATAFDFSILTRMNDGSKVRRTATLLPTRRYEVFSDNNGIWAIRELSSH